MTAPNDREFIFEQPYRNNVWRVQLCTFGEAITAAKAEIDSNGA